MVKKNIRLQCRRPWFNSWVGKIRWKRDRLPTPVFLDFLGGSEGKESACNAGDLGSIPGLGSSPGGGHGNPLQYSCLENPMDRGAWRATVHGVAKNSLANTGDLRDLGSILGLGRSPGGGHGNPLQYACLETPMGRGAWRATVRRVAESDTTEAT